jgi:hypothetical protein
MLDCLIVGGGTTVPGLYAAGDVTTGLDQISHAMGEAGVAATTIRNGLADRQLLRRWNGAPRAGPRLNTPGRRRHRR